MLDNSPSFQNSIQGIQMLCRLITGFSFGSLCLFTTLSADAVVAADRGAELVQAVAQDSPSAFPEDNAATFHKSDPRIRLQLVRLDGSAGSLGGSSVTVINPQGKSTQLTADSKGLVSLSKVTAGLHAVVVSGAGGHAAVPLMLREAAGEDSAATLPEDAAIVSNEAVTTVHLPVMPIDPREVLRVATAFLPPVPADGSVSGLESPLTVDSEVTRAHLYHVVLGPDGRMEGRIISPALPGAAPANLAGINIMVYSGNQLVARSITDGQGRFLVQNLRPGAHGLIAAGQAGYAAFAFDADFADSGEVVRHAGVENGMTLVRMMQPGAAPLPVPIIPPPMVPSVVDAIREGQGPDAPGVEPLPPGVAPVPGAGFAGGAGGAVGGGGGGLGGAAGGGLGGAGGLLALGGIGAAAAIAASNDDDRPIVLPPVATPAEPGPVAP